MRTLIAAVILLMMPLLAISPAAADDEVEDAHRQAISGRDSYWNCLAREYPRDANKRMSGQDFAAHLGGVCASERQRFRVTLLDYLEAQFPDVNADAHMATANNAIALAQKDIVTAFTRRQAQPK